MRDRRGEGEEKVARRSDDSMGAENSETHTLSQLYCHFLPLGQLFLFFVFLFLSPSLSLSLFLYLLLFNLLSCLKNYESFKCARGIVPWCFLRTALCDNTANLRHGLIFKSENISFQYIWGGGENLIKIELNPFLIALNTRLTSSFQKGTGFILNFKSHSESP